MTSHALYNCSICNFSKPDAFSGSGIYLNKVVQFEFSPQSSGYYTFVASISGGKEVFLYMVNASDPNCANQQNWLYWNLAFNHEVPTYLTAGTQIRLVATLFSDPCSPDVLLTAYVIELQRVCSLSSQVTTPPSLNQALEVNVCDPSYNRDAPWYLGGSAVVVPFTTITQGVYTFKVSTATAALGLDIFDMACMPLQFDTYGLTTTSVSLVLDANVQVKIILYTTQLCSSDNVFGSLFIESRTAGCHGTVFEGSYVSNVTWDLTNDLISRDSPLRWVKKTLGQVGPDRCLDVQFRRWNPDVCQFSSPATVRDGTTVVRDGTVSYGSSLSFTAEAEGLYTFDCRQRNEEFENFIEIFSSDCSSLGPNARFKLSGNYRALVTIPLRSGETVHPVITGNTATTMNLLTTYNPTICQDIAYAGVSIPYDTSDVAYVSLCENSAPGGVKDFAVMFNFTAPSDGIWTFTALGANSQITLSLYGGPNGNCSHLLTSLSQFPGRGAITTALDMGTPVYVVISASIEACGIDDSSVSVNAESTLKGCADVSYAGDLSSTWRYAGDVNAAPYDSPFRSLSPFSYAAEWRFQANATGIYTFLPSTSGAPGDFRLQLYSDETCNQTLGNVQSRKAVLQLNAGQSIRLVAFSQNYNEIVLKVIYSSGGPAACQGFPVAGSLPISTNNSTLRVVERDLCQFSRPINYQDYGPNAFLLQFEAPQQGLYAFAIADNSTAASALYIFEGDCSARPLGFATRDQDTAITLSGRRSLNIVVTLSSVQAQCGPVGVYVYSPLKGCYNIPVLSIDAPIINTNSILSDTSLSSMCAVDINYQSPATGSTVNFAGDIPFTAVTAGLYRFKIRSTAARENPDLQFGVEVLSQDCRTVFSSDYTDPTDTDVDQALVGVRLAAQQQVHIIVAVTTAVCSASLVLSGDMQVVSPSSASEISAGVLAAAILIPIVVIIATGGGGLWCYRRHYKRRRGHQRMLWVDPDEQHRHIQIRADEEEQYKIRL
eukprot:CAMPEP_0184666618 /NCGR_PEP_ID=MMETSP0308-20130426/62741_1 /TAXON_ID=38269 /ORGANISM="Gloeochaete witrockiana, Strain SAG 46.84" /LENGTH=998 /DNA_ID=CAMNT_0027111309 /DNA_START=259 /DNA_END=3255 /DNA_ORIENTATION=+